MERFEKGKKPNWIDQSIENRLNGLLRPVTPDPRFVQKLKKRLSAKAEIYLEKDFSSIYLMIILAGFSIMVFLSFLISRIIKK